MRQILSLNNNWKYVPEFEEHFVYTDFDDSSFEEVNLPHANREIPYNYFDEKIYQFVSCYRKEIIIPAGLKDKRYIVDFEGVMCHAKVYMNSRYVGEHKGGYTSFSFDVTEYMEPGKKNLLAVMVDSTERVDIPPFGHVIDYLTYGGIYREVSLRIVDGVYIENVHIITENVLQEKKNLSASAFCVNTTGVEQQGSVSITLKDNCGIIAQKSMPVIINASRENKFEINLQDIGEVEIWDMDSPKLYGVDICLKLSGYDDVYKARTGFRKAFFDKNGFSLNGRKVKLVGLNRHQAYPYVGYAMPERVQKRDADILKYELGLNIVRTSHYPQSRHFLDRCDEIGLLVLEEIPGWQHIGNENWKKVAVENVREMIRRDWNHPSIILWGVRINESKDDHDFYTKTNNLARELDGSRQTCGVRCLTKSELLEDVYTMNDFILGNEDRALRSQREVTGLEYDVPYLVTEYNGHMYPTKRFDNEERLIEHAMRHLCVINASGEDDCISGAIGWCAFDYNTHMDFGSGDRICHHGVMDMYRIPKWASYSYLSQVSPKNRVVMEPLTYWTVGDRNGGRVDSLTVLTNCDYIEAGICGKNIGRFYPSDGFKGIGHPPVIIKFDFREWGSRWGDMELTGFIANKAVCSKKYAENPYLSAIDAKADDTELDADKFDATRIVCKLVDQYGNILPYLNKVLTIDTFGDVEVIGPKIKASIGGCIGFWIRTTGKKSTEQAGVYIRCNGCEDIRIDIQLK